ncbi:ferrochelatase [Beggiatoa leptomitoformis]|uniref:Ferrochelatase n=1 Tax=Beggiatoa leptomitoformis TaxID=288004 RepID=A0A2N9YCI6_9GAMM|nr:ferrochelatase [Beggiatoa leptomitoformis]ALG66565.1 ferrochelatase [Beggiatoa leptomitoformis]AUI68136.1 ferrochelatase [Beggiatoa leptomitoformis]
MKSYLNTTNYNHNTIPTTGVLLMNLGTPDAPTAPALRRYLAEFLADPRITELPRWLWWFILHGIILRTRPAKSAKKYQQIWTDAGSPLLATSYIQVDKLQAILAEKFQSPVVVAMGMRYGNPSIAAGLEQLRQAQAQRILCLPLYPQYSSASTGSTFDALGDALKTWRWIPDIHFITHYHDFPPYIHALANSIQTHWATHGQPDKLLFSFHGIPKRFFLSGDPYHCECYKTARLVAEQLGLTEAQWQVVFQSRFGREEWLKPYTDETLIHLAKTGVKRVAVICAGFSVDCLETLEEIDIENRALFLQNGGETFHYIPALNADDLHIQALAALVIKYTQGFEDKSLITLQNEAEQRVKLAEKRQS